MRGSICAGSLGIQMSPCRTSMRDQFNYNLEEYGEQPYFSRMSKTSFATLALGIAVSVAFTTHIVPLSDPDHTTAALVLALVRTALTPSHLCRVDRFAD